MAIKKINNVFDHVSDATRILREIKLLRLLRHPGAQTCGDEVLMEHAAAGLVTVLWMYPCMLLKPSCDVDICVGLCRHRGNQAHHAAAEPPGVQGHLCGVRAHGDRPAPGEPGCHLRSACAQTLHRVHGVAQLPDMCGPNTDNRSSKQTTT